MKAQPGAKKAKILIVDDEEDIRKLLKGVLENEGYETELAADGKLAQQILAFNEFDLILSDVKMPNATGVQLLHYVKKETQIPIALMTAFLDILENQEAVELGANGFLSKPFNKTQLLKLVHDILGDADKEPVKENLDPDYGKIPIDDFISGRSLTCDIYVRLSAEKYLKIGYKGEEVDIERMKQYKLKNVEHLYVKKEDFGDFVGFNIRVLKAASSSKKISPETRVRLIRQTGELVLENMMLQDINRSVFDQSKVFVESATDIIMHSDRLAGVLAALEAESNLLYMHSVAVSLFSVMIARQVGWSGANTLFKVSLAGLLHDVGMKEIPEELRTKPRWELEPTEIALLEMHAARGAELLSRLPEVPGEIAQIVAQHHEECSGTGYPAGITRNHIHPLARLIAVADRFCELAVRTSEGAPLPPKEAVSRVAETSIGRLEPIYVAGLLLLFDMPIPTQLSNDHSVQTLKRKAPNRIAS